MNWKHQALEASLAAARAWRLGLEAQASDHIVSVVDAFGEAPASVAAGLDKIFGEILKAQGRRDFIRVADLLEFELRPALERAPV